MCRVINGIPVNIQALLSEKVSQALIAAGAPADCEPQVRQSAKVQFGDYQANGVMAVAKKLGMPPRQLAEQVLTHLDLSGIASKWKSPALALSISSLTRHSWQTT
jgi:arginyl-tRNA synthetase